MEGGEGCAAGGFFFVQSGVGGGTEIMKFGMEVLLGNVAAKCGLLFCNNSVVRCR